MYCYRLVCWEDGLGLWAIIPKPKEPPTLEEIVVAVANRIAVPVQTSSKPEPKPERSKPATAAEIADAVTMLLRRNQDTRELRQKEYELATQLRKAATDYESARRNIEDTCARERLRSPHCGVGATHDATLAYEKIQSDYLGQ